ncbi:MAG: hypothetical protein JSS99_03215 [Actinobacteria bacterium]|nr:hypothetical protein [Actinomycetota bacterium]
MADTTSIKATASKPRAAARRRPRSTAKARTTAARATTARSTSTSTRPATRGARAQRLAERVVLIPVGAALEARDRVAGSVGELVTTTRSRTALERQLERFERRGGSARTQLEREVRRTRTRLEHQTRTARRGFGRQRTHARRNLDANVEALTTRVEKVVQNGVDTGMRLVNGAQDRLGRVV